MLLDPDSWSDPAYFVTSRLCWSNLPCFFPVSCACPINMQWLPGDGAVCGSSLCCSAKKHETCHTVDCAFSMTRCCNSQCNTYNIRWLYTICIYIYMYIYVYMNNDLYYNILCNIGALIRWASWSASMIGQHGKPRRRSACARMVLQTRSPILCCRLISYGNHWATRLNVRLVISRHSPAFLALPCDCWSFPALTDRGSSPIWPRTQLRQRPNLSRLFGNFRNEDQCLRISRQRSSEIWKLL